LFIDGLNPHKALLGKIPVEGHNKSLQPVKAQPNNHHPIPITIYHYLSKQDGKKNVMFLNILIMET